jgi:hypothetical protein
MTDLFKDILPSILQSKKDVLENEKDYKPFVINKALSFYYDCILQSNEMNRYPNLPPKLQYDYLRNSIRGYKRKYAPWMKRETDTNIDIIREYYGYSYEKSKEILPLLSKKQLKELEKRLDKGGTK